MADACAIQLTMIVMNSHVISLLINFITAISWLSHVSIATDICMVWLG
jgi:hypothetical protein